MIYIYIYSTFMEKWLMDQRLKNIQEFVETPRRKKKKLKKKKLKKIKIKIKLTNS